MKARATSDIKQNQLGQYNNNMCVNIIMTNRMGSKIQTWSTPDLIYIQDVALPSKITKFCLHDLIQFLIFPDSINFQLYSQNHLWGKSVNGFKIKKLHKSVLDTQQYQFKRFLHVCYDRIQYNRFKELMSTKLIEDFLSVFPISSFFFIFGLKNKFILISLKRKIIK